MYGPGSPFRAWKHSDVSSVMTGRPAHGEGGRRKLERETINVRDCRRDTEGVTKG